LEDSKDLLDKFFDFLYETIETHESTVALSGRFEEIAEEQRNSKTLHVGESQGGKKSQGDGKKQGSGQQQGNGQQQGSGPQQGGNKPQGGGKSQGGGQSQGQPQGGNQSQGGSKSNGSGSSGNDSRGTKEKKPGQPPKTCPFCKAGGHPPSRCSTVFGMDVDQRWKAVTSASPSLCFKCLMTGHGTALCPEAGCTVPNCNGSRPHHAILHKGAPATTSN
jgi:hypothetical protein